MSGRCFEGVGVVGSGPAGLAAGMILARYGGPHVVFGDSPGGLIAQARRVDNLPAAAPGRTGPDWACCLEERARLGGVNLKTVRVERLVREPSGQGYRIDTPSDVFAFHRVILATGTRPRPLKGPGGQDWLALPGVFSGVRALLAACPEPQEVLVLGGGDAAVDQALTLAGAGYRVRVCLRCPDSLRALPLLLREARQHPGISWQMQGELRDMERVGDGLEVSFALIGEGKVMHRVSAVLVAWGREPERSLLVGMDPQILEGEMARGRLVLAGDVLGGVCRQMSIAQGDGVRVGMALALLETGMAEVRAHELLHRGGYGR